MFHRGTTTEIEKLIHAAKQDLHEEYKKHKGETSGRVYRVPIMGGAFWNHQQLEDMHRFALHVLGDLVDSVREFKEGTIDTESQVQNAEQIRDLLGETKSLEEYMQNRFPRTFEMSNKGMNPMTGKTPAGHAQWFMENKLETKRGRPKQNV